MAENECGAAAAAQKAEPPLRPTIAVPTRSYESLFRGGGGGGAYDVSPGPMTLVSSFFAEEPDSNCRSFSQLLAGAMASPAATPSRALVSFPTVEATEKADSGGGGGGEGPVMQNRAPLSFLVASSPFFMVPPVLSPAGWLDSSSLLFSPGPGQFGISHQEALAQVTAQASQTQSHIPIQAEYPSSAATAVTMTQPTSSGINMALLQHMSLQTSDTNNTTSESAEDTLCDQSSPPVALTIDKPADDGYNWRKYGQKQVKGSECPRSYYKCTHPSCPVKKKVERSLDGHVTEIIYRGQHNHLQPAPNRRGKEGGTFPGMCNEFNGSLDFPANSETVLQGESGNFSRSSDTMAAPSISKRERESGNGTSEQLSGSSDDEVGDAKLVTDEGDNTKPVLKRRNTDSSIMESTSSHRPVTESRIIMQTTSEVDLLDDGFRWRKYGQKVVKGNPHPRSYYKCTSAGCNVRKHVERASTDSKDVITTYEGKHNHDIPAARNSSHKTASAGAVVNSLHPKVHTKIPNNQDIRNNVQQSVSFLKLKKEGPT